MSGSSLHLGSAEFSFLPGDSLEQTGKPGVDIAQLIRDIMHLPSDEIDFRFREAGVHVEVVEGASMPGYHHPSTPLSETGMRVSETLDIPPVLPDFLAIFERHMLFSHELTVHAGSSQDRMKRYRNYIEHLQEFLPFVSLSYQEQIRSFSFPTQQSVESMIESLNRAGILPEQVIEEVNRYEVKYGNNKVSIRTILAFSGLSSYKKIFDTFLSNGVTMPSSQKPEITDQELLTFIQSELSKALNFVRNYLNTPEVWQYIQSEYGENVMRSIFQELEDLEGGYITRIGKLDISDLKPLDYTIFYKAYIALINRLFELEVIPQKISFVGLKDE